MSNEEEEIISNEINDEQSTQDQSNLQVTETNDENETIENIDNIENPQEQNVRDTEEGSIIETKTEEPNLEEPKPESQASGLQNEEVEEQIEKKQDIIILGTGLKNTILAGCFAMKGKKVLNLDVHPYQGSETASLNLTRMLEKFKKALPGFKWKDRDWSLDLIPKVIMSSSLLVELILSTSVQDQLEFVPIECTQVYQQRKAGWLTSEGGVICKVPLTPTEALMSDLMDLLEKNRCRSFLSQVIGVKLDDKKTWGSKDLDTMTAEELQKKQGLGKNTIDFIGHAVALYTTDDYLTKSAKPMVRNIQNFLDSYGKYSKTSAFIYPRYGLGSLSEGFSRYCATRGGTQILNVKFKGFERKGDQVEAVHIHQTDEDAGIDNDFRIECDQVLVEPSQVLDLDLVQTKGKIQRNIVILEGDKPIKDPTGQIIFPHKQLNRSNDVFVLILDESVEVCAEGYWVAIISTVAETSTPIHEVKEVFNQIIKGETNVITMFDQVTECQEPSGGTPQVGNMFITSSMDEQSHFDKGVNEVVEIYEKCLGEKFNLEVMKKELERARQIQQGIITD